MEITLLSRLQHKNIVAYIGTEKSEQMINIFLEYVGGGSISSIIKCFGAFTETLIKVYMR